MTKVQLSERKTSSSKGRSSNFLLRTLSSDDYETLRPDIQIIHYPSGKALYEPEDEIEHVYFPEEGLISLISIMQSGHEVESAVVGREGAVGFVEAVGAGVMFSRAVVQIDLKGTRVPVRAYAAAFDSSPAFRRAIAAHIELTIAEGRQTIACISYHQLIQRFAWWILECQDRTGRDELALTQEFLAAMLGVQRTSVSGVAGKLKAKGLIDYKRGVISIKDRAGLKRTSCECYNTNAHFRSLIEKRLKPR